MAKNVLIATLGESPIVVTSMVRALQAKKDLTIDQLHVIHPQGEKLIDLGYNLLKEHLNGECIVTRSILPFPDANSRETSIEFLGVLSDSIQTHEDTGDSVYLSLAGGRKNMSALMAVICQFFGCIRGLYHVLDKYEDDPTKQNFHSIEALFDFEEDMRGEKLSRPPMNSSWLKFPMNNYQAVLPCGSISMRRNLTRMYRCPLRLMTNLRRLVVKFFSKRKPMSLMFIYLKRHIIFTKPTAVKQQNG